MSDMKKKILIVDDEPTNILVLKGLLKQMGHEVVSAENAIVALKVLDRSFDLVLADVMMPRMSGFEMIERIRSNQHTHDLPVIMVTTLFEKVDRLKAVEVGANDFITKPIDALELKVRVNSMLRQKAQQDEINAFTFDLNQLVEERTVELKQAWVELDKANREAIQVLSAAAEYKDDDTASHIRRMALSSELIADKMDLNKKEVDLIFTSSPMHDVGKIGIPDHILLKPGKLDADEWNIMKEHSIIGGNILGVCSSDYMIMGKIIALSHHEKWDGSGYPAGLAGEDIPLAGRICAVADVFDALTSRRPYKEAFSVEKAVGIMQECRGNHFDPKVLDVFLDNLDGVLAIKENRREEVGERFMQK